MKNGKFYGKGKCTFNDGETYEGEWKEGLQHGKGEFYGQTDLFMKVDMNMANVLKGRLNRAL